MRLCSLCSKTTKTKPLDMDDLFFGTYVKVMRRSGLSKHKEKLGICSSCMPRYRKMEQEFRKKQIIFGILGLVFAILYFSFTGNLLLSVLLALFIAALSLLSYCPPLKSE